MKNTIARKVFDKVRDALFDGALSHTVFGHHGKCCAIDTIWALREDKFRAYLAADDKLAYLATLPWIGDITKYHLAKNFGVDCAKPDVHLQRLADHHGVTPQVLCDDLARQTGYRSATVDVLLWRACANGVIDSRSGRIVESDLVQA